MCVQVEKMYFILTAKSLLWATLSVVSTITLFTAIYSPKWLIGPTDYNCLSSKSLSAESKFIQIKPTCNLIILRLKTVSNRRDGLEKNYMPYAHV